MGLGTSLRHRIGNECELVGGTGNGFEVTGGTGNEHKYDAKYTLRACHSSKHTSHINHCPNITKANQLMDTR